MCTRKESPVVVIEWVEGKTLDTYLNRNLNDKYELEDEKRTKTAKSINSH